MNKTTAKIVELKVTDIVGFSEIFIGIMITTNIKDIGHVTVHMQLGENTPELNDLFQKNDYVKLFYEYLKLAIAKLEG